MRSWAEDCGLWVVGCGLWAGGLAGLGWLFVGGRSTTLAIYSIPNPLYASLLSLTLSLSSSSKKSRLLLLPPALFSSPDLTLFSPLSSFLLLPPPLPPSPSHARDLLPPSAADHRASLALPFLLPASPPSPIPSALLVIPTSRPAFSPASSVLVLFVVLLAGAGDFQVTSPSLLPAPLVLTCRPGRVWSHSRLVRSLS